VLKNSENSKPVSVGTGDVVVFRKAEYEAPRQKTLGEVADLVRGFEPMGKGTVGGTLYDLGSYPGAVLTRAARGG